jgi:hypothetical protein
MMKVVGCECDDVTLYTIFLQIITFSWARKTCSCFSTSTTPFTHCLTCYTRIWCWVKNECMCDYRCVEYYYMLTRVSSMSAHESEVSVIPSHFTPRLFFSCTKYHLDFDHLHHHDKCQAPRIWKTIKCFMLNTILLTANQEQNENWNRQQRQGPYIINEIV